MLDTTRYIIWKENINFSWDYFLLKYEPKNVKEAAFIATNISWTTETNEKENIIICYTQTYLDKKESWSLYYNKIDADSCKSNGLLNHELGHFNIDEIYARESRMLISKIKAKSFEKVYDEIQKIAQKTLNKRFREQTKYDEETEHGTNKEKQAEWDKQIAERLRELEQYKDIVVTIRLQSR